MRLHGAGQGDGTPTQTRASAKRGETLVSDIVARLLGRADIAERVGLRSQPLSDEALDRLCDALISDDETEALGMIAEAQAEGASPDRIYHTYIAAAARRLGERWVADTATFFEVTLGLGRLHAAVHEMGPFFLPPAQGKPGPHALFAPVPGETHVLGVVMAADFFRRSGWQVALEASPSPDELIRAARRRAYALIGLSAASRRMVEPLAQMIVQLRRACPGALVVVGGHILELEPDIAAKVGADRVVADAVAGSVALRTDLSTVPISS